MDEHPELDEAKGWVVLSVHVQPGARRSEVAGRHGDALKVRIAAPPIDGRANEAVLALVSEEFGLRGATWSWCRGRPVVASGSASAN